MLHYSDELKNSTVSCSIHAHALLRFCMPWNLQEEALQEAIELLDSLDPARALDDHKWMQVGLALCAVNFSLQGEWARWSLRCGRAEAPAVDGAGRTIRNSQGERSMLDIATACEQRWSTVEAFRPFTNADCDKISAIRRSCVGSGGRRESPHSGLRHTEDSVGGPAEGRVLEFRHLDGRPFRTQAVRVQEGYLGPADGWVPRATENDDTLEIDARVHLGDWVSLRPDSPPSSVARSNKSSPATG